MLGVILLLLIIVPFLIPVKAPEGLAAAIELASPDSKFTNIPFEGTDGIKIHYFEGNSYGSTLAVRAALTEPDRIEGLILVDPAVYVGGEMPSWIVKIPQIKHLGPLLARSLGSGDSFFNQTYLDPSKLSEKRMGMIKINTKMTNWDTAL
ncbi:MAG: hypothetical protein PF693_10560 [Spirochaetia bacterium]|nr:hypothetical protein [Spirochaetia bacterium]